MERRHEHTCEATGPLRGACPREPTLGDSQRESLALCRGPRWRHRFIKPPTEFSDKDGLAIGTCRLCALSGGKASGCLVWHTCIYMQLSAEELNSTRASLLQARPWNDNTA